jgi:hypothetical protein
MATKHKHKPFNKSQLRLIARAVDDRLRFLGEEKEFSDVDKETARFEALEVELAKRLGEIEPREKGQKVVRLALSADEDDDLKDIAQEKFREFFVYQMRKEGDDIEDYGFTEFRANFCCFLCMGDCEELPGLDGKTYRLRIEEI